MVYGIFVLYIALVLAVDGLGIARPGQYLLGGSTLLFLLLLARRSPSHERREMWFCVAFSTLVELGCTQLWGLYAYRLGNVPAFVPPGHGLIFLVAAQASRERRVVAHGRALALATIGIATVVGGRGLLAGDVHGAIYWPFFVGFLGWSRKAPVHAITFVITTALEHAGVAFGNWTWARTVPGLGLSSSDPPSLIAGGYCMFAVVATGLAGLSYVPGATRTKRCS